MTTSRLFGEIRRLLSVRANEVPDFELESWVQASLTWFAAEVEFDVVTDEGIGIAADELEIPLPKDLAYFVWVKWNDVALTPIGVYLLDQQENWQATESGTPTQFAVQGRNLILNPPPSSTAITTDSTLSWRYIGSGTRLPASGPPGLSDLDEQLIRYDAAIGWLGAHIDTDSMQPFQMKIASFTAEVQRRLPQARKRWQDPANLNVFQIRPLVDRLGSR